MKRNHPIHDRAHPPLSMQSRPKNGHERMGFLRAKPNKKRDQQDEHFKDPRRRRDSVNDQNLQRKSPYEP